MSDGYVWNCLCVLVNADTLVFSRNLDGLYTQKKKKNRRTSPTILKKP